MSEKSGSEKYTILLRLTFLAVSLAILIRIVDVKLVMNHVRDIPLRVLGFLVLLSIIRIWLTGLRWQLLNPDVSGQLSRWHYFRLMMISNTFNLFMPGALGGDIIRIALTMKTIQNKKLENLIAIVADRLIGFFSIIVLGSIALLFMSDIQDKWVFYLIFGLMLGIFLLTFIIAINTRMLRLLQSFFLWLGAIGSRLITLLETWKNALIFFRDNYLRVLGAILICLPIHGLAFLIAYFIAISLNIKVSFFDLCIILSLVWVIVAIPITIYGAGVRELSLIYFLSLYGVEAEKAAALSVYLYIIALCVGFIVFFLILFDKCILKTQKITETT